MSSVSEESRSPADKSADKSPEHPPNKPGISPLQGILWMIVSTLMFVAVTGIVRYLGSGLPAGEAAFIRYAMGLLLVLPIFLRMAKNMPSMDVIRNGAIRGLPIHLASPCGFTPWLAFQLPK